ncbi:MAG: hypothetical protein IKL27_01430 [Oscillospiraceae bacterium]|nr:hypothetical protein [Oscillospiraceae bacterium]
MLPETKVSFKTDNAALQRLYDTAEAKCLNNLRLFGDRQVLVEGGGYEKIWLETQPMGGEMYAKRNMTAALNNQLFFMETQREDGRIAGSIQCMPDGSVEPQFNKFQGFCFPWHALNIYYWLGEDRAFLDRLALSLEKFDEYLWRTRDSDGDGCLEAYCVYDTGEDNALRYGDSPVYCTTDYPPEVSSVVPMASMDIMSFSYSARDTLAEISRIRGDGREEEWRKAADDVAAALKAHLWNDEKGACFDKDKFGNVMPTLVHNNLRCMYWGSFSKDMADRFVNEHLLNEAEFWTYLPLPSVAVNDPLFRNAPENNWSGQVEGLTYQRALLALERYGYEKIVTRLGKKLFDAVIKGGYVFTQQFDPFTAEPSRVGMISHEPLAAGSEEAFQDSYGPTILAVLEYIAHIWGVHMNMGQLWFSLGSGVKYTYEQQWGEHVYRIESDGETARVLFDGVEKLCHACGVRLITDLQGNLLDTRIIE